MLELKIFLLRAGLTQRKIAQRLGIKPPHVSCIFHSKRKALHLRKRMTEELGIPAELIQYHPPERRTVA